MHEQDRRPLSFVKCGGVSHATLTHPTLTLPGCRAGVPDPARGRAERGARGRDAGVRAPGRLHGRLRPARPPCLQATLPRGARRRLASCAGCWKQLCLARPFPADYKVQKYRRRVLVVHALARSALAAVSCQSVGAPDGGHWVIQGPTRCCKIQGAMQTRWGKEPALARSAGAALACIISTASAATRWMLPAHFCWGPGFCQEAVYFMGDQIGCQLLCHEVALV